MINSGSSTRKKSVTWQVKPLVNPIKSLQKYLTSLNYHVNQLPLSSQNELKKCCKTVDSLLEDLQVAQDDLLQQNREWKSRYEAALQLSGEEQFKSLVANIPGAIYRSTYRSDWTMEFISDAIQDISAYPASDFIHNSVRPFTSIIHPEDIAMVKRVINEGVQAKQPYIIEYRIIRADGSTAWVYEKGQGIFAEDGTLLWLDGAIFDISDRKQLEIELSHREQELSDFVNNGAMGLHWVGADGSILWANQAELDLLGYSHEEYIGHHISEFHADKDVIDDILRRLQANETLLNYQARLLCKNGSIKYVLINSNVYWKDGQFIHTRCFTRDITERKQTQTALRKSQQLLQAIIDNSPAVIDVVNTRQQHLLVNRRYEHLVSLSRKQCIGKSIYDIWPHEIADGFAANHQRVLESGIPLEIEEVVPQEDGMHTYISSKFPLHDASGLPYAVCSISTDISDRKIAEQKLQQSEELFRSLSACSPVGIFLTDTEGRCTYTNPRCQAICGFTHEESLGEGWSQSIYPEDRERVFADWSKSTREGREYSNEFRIQTKDGTVRWVHVRSSPMFSDKTELMGHVGTIEDISDRKQVLERLNESENRWRTIIETEPECVKVVASDGTLLEMNAAGLAMIEFPSVDAAIGQSVYSLIAPEHREAFIALNESVCQGNRGTLEFEIIGLQGTRRWMETHAVPLRNESDGTLVHLAITRDITARKQAEEQLSQLNSALENAVEGISRLDTQGRYISVNKAYAMMLGYQPEEMIGMAWQATVHPDELQRLKKAYQQMLKKGKVEVEARGVRKDGSIFHKQVVMVAAYDSQRQLIGHHCFAKDITERKMAEEALKRAKQELEIRVQERTAELSAANEQLLSEVVERQRAEKELERSLSLLRGTLEATADGIVVSQNGRHITTFNQKFVEMWSIPEAIITSRELNQLVPWILEQLKDPEGFLAPTQELLSQPDAEGYGTYELKDGRVFERYSHPQRIGKNIVGRVCSFRDITERQRAQEAIQESEERFRQLAENIHEVFWMADETLSKILYVSPAYEKIWGRTCESFDEQHTFFWDSIHPEDQECVLFGREKILQGEPTQVEYRIIRPDGSIRWVWNRAFPIKEQSDQMYRICGIAQDITERKQAEEALKKAHDELEIRVEERTAQLRKALRQLQSEMAERKHAEAALRESQQQLQAILDNSPAIVYLKDTQGRILLVNRQCETLYHIKREAVIGKSAYDFFPPEITDTLWANDQKVLQSGKPLKIEEAVPQEDGLHTYISIKFPLYDSAGTPYAVCGISTDITDRKKAEEELQRSEARFRALACREALLNRLASQIRNSLDLDTILETAVQEIYNRLAVDLCVFAWYAKDGTPSGWEVVKEAKNLELPSFLGLYPIESWRPFTCKLLNQEEFSADNVTQRDACSGTQSSQWFMQQMPLPYGTAALLSLPIETQSGQLGTLTCGRLLYNQSWTDEEVELLQAVTNQLVIGINQAQLYEQSRIAASTAQSKATQLEFALHKLQQTQAQLIQSEKMSSLGQLVAGVAHEINNPLNFIHANLTHAHQYADDLLNLMQLYEESYTHPAPKIQAEAEAIDLDFLKEDLPKILKSMEMGADRIRQIVLSLRSFSRLDREEMKWTNIHEGLDDTLLILTHRLKDRANHPGIKVIKEYGSLPKVQCYPGQLNQVFMNILSNAIDALDELLVQQNITQMGWLNVESSVNNGSQWTASSEQLANLQPLTPTIWIRSCVNHSDQVVIRIADNGFGMTQEIQQRIFDPFFTTKPVGQGTGLGMSISYQIVVEKHSGQLECISAPGQGTEFIISIPIEQPKNRCLLQEGWVESSANEEANSMAFPSVALERTAWTSQERS